METSTALAVRPNVQIVQDAYNHFLQGNIQGIIDLCTDEVAWGTFKNAEVPYSGMFYGKEGVLEFFQALGSTVEFKSFTPKEFFSDGNDVFVLGREEAVVKETGGTYDDDWCMHFRLREGKIRHFFAFVDTYSQNRAFRKM
jgi:uncharacterized protein